MVYASLKSHLQDFIWEYLKEARRFIDCLWLLIGDWNQVLQNGGNQVCQSLFEKFLEVINVCIFKEAWIFWTTIYLDK